MFRFIRQLRLALSTDMAQADLVTLLSNLNPSKYSFSERMVALGQIMDWVRLPVKSQAPTYVSDFVHSRDVRVKFLFQFLERNQEQGKYLAQTLQELIVPGGAVSLYCLTGISENHGFFTELSNRIVQKVLPDTHIEKDLSDTFKTLFIEEEDAIWLETSLKNVYPLFIEFTKRHNFNFEALKLDGRESMVILGAQVATLGTSRDIRRRMDEQRLIDSSFLRLNAVINANSSDDAILREISASRLSLQTVRNNLEASGVSVDLIFKIEKISSILDRIEMLIYLGRYYGKEAAPLITGQFMGRLIRDELESWGVKIYIRENLHLLTRKIVERAGEKGFNYIATTGEEKRHLFIAAMWAGVLTAFTAICKFFIAVPRFPLFFEGFFFFVNYAFGFLMLQKFHMALSSKQPAYTASALSRKFESFKITKELEEVTSEVKKIAYSQFITALGNILLVVPCIIGADWLWVYLFGHHMMTPAEAFGTIGKHDPLTSFTIPFAILTGVLLWLSSVIAGWMENWVVFRDIPEAMRANSFLKKVLSRDKINFLADHFASTVGGIAGNLSIAFFLAAPVIIGKFTALPLDIRHVTLAAGTVTLALNAIEWNLDYWPLILSMGISIFIIGCLNFSVSFYCALRMAALARDVESKYLKIIFRYAFFKRKSKAALPEQTTPKEGP